MSFFSPEWASLDDEEASERVRLNFAAALERLPEDVGRTAREILRLDLRSALIDRIVLRARRNEIEIHLIVGDNSAGYSLLRLQYSDATFFDTSMEVLESAARTRNLDVRFDEFEMLEPDGPSDYVAHRLLLANNDVIAVRFRTIATALTPISERKYFSYGQTLLLD